MFKKFFYYISLRFVLTTKFLNCNKAFIFQIHAQMIILALIFYGCIHVYTYINTWIHITLSSLDMNQPDCRSINAYGLDLQKDMRPNTPLKEGLWSMKFLYTVFWIQYGSLLSIVSQPIKAFVHCHCKIGFGNSRKQVKSTFY